MDCPKPMPSYWSLANEVTHLHGYCDTLEVEIDDLKKENAELLETLDETEKMYIAEWNRACNTERDNEKLRNLLLDFRDAMCNYGEWTGPFDERMFELGVFRGR